MLKKRVGLVGLVLLVCCAGFAQAETMNIQGADSIFDAYMSTGSVLTDLSTIGVREYGNGMDYDYRIFLRVDLSAIPAGAVIDSASMNLKLKSLSVTKPLALYKVSPFTEGVTALTSDGTTAWPGGTFDGVNGYWQTPEDKVLVKLDCDPNAVGSFVPFAGDALADYIQAQSDLTADRYAYLQVAMKDIPCSTWAIFHSTEADLAADRPYLAVNYTVPEPMTLSLLAMGGVALLRRKG